MRLIVLIVILAVGCSTTIADEKPAETPKSEREVQPAASESPSVDFARDIQPLFAKKCFSCHGPDEAEGSLRLHRKADALRGGNKGPIVKAGHSAESRLIQYVTGENEDELIMPPEGERLAVAEVKLLKTWIDQGAKWPDEPAGTSANPAARQHWSFQPISNPVPPMVKHADRVRNGIDAFILARLEKEGLTLSLEADRPTLIRRLYIDLLGLPPESADVEEFVNDTRPDAYELLVEQVLASPHYGERWGRHWLDMARYADSDGYEKDTGRPHAWRYRNWVIEALNRDMPFTQFTLEQLAGDLLPDATLNQKIATGFHRNTLTNKEGGVDQEEFRVAATVDRVNTTGAVWLGLTVGCAQCHTHKYDPLAQREYYGLFSFFNSAQEVDVPAPLPEHAAAFAKTKKTFDDQHAPLVAAVKKFEQEQLATRQAAWERSFEGKLDQVAHWVPLTTEKAEATGGVTLKNQPDGIVLAGGKSPAVSAYTLTYKIDLQGITGLRLEVLPDASLRGSGPGRAANGNFVLSEIKVTVAKDNGKPEPVTLVNSLADYAQDNYPIAAAIDGNAKTGWAIGTETARKHTAVFQTKEPISAAGTTLLTITLDQQHGQENLIGKLRISVTASTGPLGIEGLTSDVAKILAVPASERTAEQKTALAKYYRAEDAELAHLEQAVAQHLTSAPLDPGTVNKAQALVELPKPRKTHVLIRGDFLRQGAEVESHVPEVLHPLKPRAERPDRIDLARWLVDPANPLTSRVTVNRVWQRYFGRGLVASLDDFGTQGERPTHPELLDWLARQFMSRNWSLKNLHTLIVTSAAYRQSSRVTPELLRRDPMNTLLARQSRLRVDAEIIRDLALASSGLMNYAIGGPSVKPPQPAGISELTYAGSARWVESQGPDRYRRGLYTWFQRTSPYPMLMTFDSPDSNVTCTRRERSNTPLQALTLLNDPAFFECAQGLARRLVKEATPDGGASSDSKTLRGARLRYVFQVCLARAPEADELVELNDLFDQQQKLCAADTKAAAALIGTSEKPEGVSVPELAAWVVVSRTLMNLDEFIVRE
jgi:mono/diheme cytochrome c family protein